MKENYEIRTVEHQDIATVVEIVRKSFDDNYLIPSVYRGKGIAEFISHELNNPYSPYRYFVICNETEIAGFAEFKVYNTDSIAFLNIISINNTYKGKGIGKYFMEYAKDFFIKLEYNSIQLDVYKSNLVALKYYDAFGFKKISSNSFYRINPKVSSTCDISIVNFPQYKEMMDIFGFYFIDLNIDNSSIRLGCIANDIIVRGEYGLPLQKTIKDIAKFLSVNNIYLIGNNCATEDTLFVDEIYRFELKLKA